MSKSPYIKELKDFNVDDGFQQKRLKVFQIIDTKSKSEDISWALEFIVIVFYFIDYTSKSICRRYMISHELQ